MLPFTVVGLGRVPRGWVQPLPPPDGLGASTRFCGRAQGRRHVFCYAANATDNGAGLDHVANRCLQPSRFYFRCSVTNRLTSAASNDTLSN